MRIRGDASLTRRLDTSPWRDPRLIAGAVLVLTSAVAGGWVVESADDTASYWATRTDVRGGDPVRTEDLVAVRAHVPAQTARGLMPTGRALPGRVADLRWAADAPRGTLVTGAAFASRRNAVELPISVSSGGLPGDLRRGDRVDVWAVPERVTTDGKAASVRSRRMLSGVTVVARNSASGIASGPGVTLVVDVAGTTVDDDLMGALATSRLTVVRVP